MMTRDNTQRDKMQTRSSPAEFRVLDNDGKRIEGYFAVFGGTYELWPGATESIDPGAFDGALSDDIRALVDHETRLVLGRTKAGTLELKTDTHGLWGSIKINDLDSDAMNLYARIQRGDVTQCSFGFDILSERTDIDGEKIHWTIEKVKLYEVSCVTFPAYEDTSISARKHDALEITRRALVQWRETQKARLLHA